MARYGAAAPSGVSENHVASQQASQKASRSGGSGAPQPTQRAAGSASGAGTAGGSGGWRAAGASPLGGSAGGKARSQWAVERLRRALADGPQPAPQTQEMVRRLGSGVRTLRRARKALGVQDRKVGQDSGAYWEWSLPSANAPVRAASTPAPDPATTSYLPDDEPALREWRPRGTQTCCKCLQPLLPGDRPPHCREYRPYARADP